MFSTAAAPRYGVLPLVPNQPMPSRTRSIVSAYAPPVSGAVIFALTVALAPTGTSAPSAVRRPSQTTVFPAVSCQWYERSTRFGPVAFHAAAPLFFSVTGTV